MSIRDSGIQIILLRSIGKLNILYSNVRPLTRPLTPALACVPGMAQNYRGDPPSQRLRRGEEVLVPGVREAEDFTGVARQRRVNVGGGES